MSEIKTIPTPGNRYKVKSGDSIKQISLRAYGTDLEVTKIVQANKTAFTGRGISIEGLPVIYNGEIIVIPVIKKRQVSKSKLTGKDKNDFTVVLEGREIPVTSGSLFLSMNMASDTWSASVPWAPGEDKKLDQLLLPFKYPKSEIYLGGELQNVGGLYQVSPSLTAKASIKNLVGFSSTIDLVDSTVNPPYEKNNQTLEQIAADTIAGTGMEAVFTADTGGAFDRATANPDETKFAYLARLAAQRGLIVSNTIQGNPLFQVAKTSGKSVGTLEEGGPFVLSWSASYDGRQLFRTYQALGQTPGGESQTGEAIDENVPGSRNTTFTANETTEGNIKKAAEWQRSRRYASALTIPIPVAGWYAPNGQLWRSNTLITIISPTLDIPNGFTLIIESVEFTFSTTGNTATLNTVPPETYTKDPIPYIWSQT
jgi:prophage tail gpP-like protein